MDLLQSPADGISPLTGMQLVTKKVKRLVSMGGKHVMNDNASEFNYDGNPPATMYVYANWPTDIVNADYYIGFSVDIKPDDSRTGVTDPIKRIWDIVQMNSTRSSWDEIAVLYAVRGLDHAGTTYFNFATTPGKDLVNANGFNRWANEPGNMQYLGKVAADTTFERVLTSLLKLNQPPIANGFLMMYYYPNAHLLNAWGSYDPEGEPVKFWWTKIAGPAQYHMLYPEASTPVISKLVVGTYSFQLRVTDNEGATAYDTVDIINAVPLSQANNNGRILTESEQRLLVNNKLIISPNPANDQLQLRWSDDYLGAVTLTVTDMSGKVVKVINLNKEHKGHLTTLKLNDIKPGSYHLFLHMKNGRSLSSKFIKQ
jgi:hypothetical protein